MPKAPGQVVAEHFGDKPTPTDLWIAIANMNEMGRLFVPDDALNQIQGKRLDNPEEYVTERDIPPEDLMHRKGPEPKPKAGPPKMIYKAPPK